MSYEVKYTSRFKRDYKRMQRRGKEMSKLLDVIDMLREGQVLPPQYQDHPLHGDYEGHRDCHIEPDWLLEYQYYENQLILMCIRVGSHNELFKKYDKGKQDNTRRI